MAIAFDATSSAKTVSSTTTLTYSHTCAGSNRMLVVGVQTDQISADPTGVTYNGVAMTKAIGGSNAGGTRRSSLWYLADPATGANNVVVTLGTASWTTSGAVSLTGTMPTIGVTGTNYATTGTPITVSVTTESANSWLVDSIYQNNGALSLSVGAGQTQRYNEASADGFDGYGSTEPTTGAGSYTMSWTQGSGAADGWVTSTVEIKELVAILNIPDARVFFM